MSVECGSRCHAATVGLNDTQRSHRMVAASTFSGNESLGRHLTRVHRECSTRNHEAS